MSSVSRTTFNSNTNTLYPDNASGEITPADLRAQMDDIADSVAFFTFSNTGAPDANDDSANSGSSGTFRVGDQWVDNNTSTLYTCLSASVGAAIWLTIPNATEFVGLDNVQILSNKTLLSPNMDGLTTWRDDDKAIWGDNSDLQIYHDGISSRIRDVGPGDLRIEGSNIRLEDFSTDGNFIRCFSGAAVEISFNNVAKLLTTSTGIDVSGTITTDGLTVGGTITSAGIDVTGDVSFGDNDKAIFGAGSDLQIYHDGTNSIIYEGGTGDLQLRGNGSATTIMNGGGSETLAHFANNSAVTLYYNNSPKIATTATGIDVTGTVTADNILTTGTLSSSKAAGYGAVEVGGPSGGLIDLKAPFSDDYDARIIYNAGADLQIITVADEPIRLKQGNSIKLQTTSTGANVQGNFDATNTIAVGTAVTNGARLTIESGQVNPTLTGTMATGYFVAQTSSGGPALNVGSDSSGTWYNSAYSNNAGIARIHRWLVGGEEAMRLDASGNVGIGTSSPSVELHIQNTSGDADVQIESTSAGGDARLNLYSNSAGSSQIRFGDEVTVNVGSLTYNHVDNSMVFRVSSSEKMRIDSSGNVGIGTGSPSHPLDVTGTVRSDVSTTGDFNFYATSTGGGAIRIYPDDATTANPTWLYQSNSSEDQAWVIGGVEIMRIDGSGNALVGKTTAVGSSTLGHELRSSGIAYHTSAGACLSLNKITTTGTITAFKYNDSTVGTISVTGSATSYNTSSDYRLKENITPIQGAADIVKMMRPCTYTFKSDGSWSDGFIAHEMQELHPQAVTGSKDAMKDEEYEVSSSVEATFDADGVELTPAEDAVMGTRSVPAYQGVDYSKLTPILTAALQEALAKIAELETRITALEGA
jgi:hypothetical protein